MIRVVMGILNILHTRVGTYIMTVEIVCVTLFPDDLFVSDKLMQSAKYPLLMCYYTVV